MTAFPLVERVRRLAEKAHGTAGRFEARELCTDAPALADVAEQALKALAGMVAEYDKLSRYGSPLAKAANERVNEARRVLALAEKDVT